jgi:hypothetical protein
MTEKSADFFYKNATWGGSVSAVAAVTSACLASLATSATGMFFKR